jgi:peptidyl-prolyl cis-trans isomerase B (cyclophilin B)
VSFSYTLAGLGSLVLVAGAPGTQDPAPSVTYTLTAPEIYILGEAFEVQLEIQAATESAAEIPSWALSAAAFSVKGTALGSHEDAKGLPLGKGQRITTSLDIGPVLAATSLAGESELVLALNLGEGQEVRVPILRAAPEGLDFMTMPVEQLAGYHLVLLTMYGPIRAEMWPDVAPNHVRNFLDLAYTGFYDDNHFHRVVPGMMIQGGSDRPGRLAPRTLKNEFNARRHVPGVLSMARFGVDTKDKNGQNIPAFDSASSEFFIMHAVFPSLDGKYTGFGKVLTGMPAVEAVVDSVKTGFNRNNPATHKPRTRQIIRRAIVVKAPPGPPGNSDF